MKVLVVLNKNSGGLPDIVYDDTVKKIKNVFNRFEIETEIIGMNNHSISEIFKSKLDKSIDAVVAGGGDGTISSVAGALAFNEIPLAILPAGTLNHFAKDLKIPLELEKAAEIISKRKIIKVDAGEVNGKIFINNSSIGFYPKIVKKRIENQELGASRWTAMGDAIVNVFKKYPLLEVNLMYENEKINCKTPFVFIGNNKYYTDIFSLGAREKLNEGYLSIYYPNSYDKYSMLRFAFLALINKLDTPEDFTALLTKEFKIEIKVQKIETALDGELYSLKPPLEYKIIPGCLNVIVP